VKIPERLQPLERDEKYGVPLHDLLEQAGVGFVNGGGTKADNQGQIVYCYLDVEVSNLEAGKRLIREFLENRYAPAGSKIIEYAPGGFLQALTKAE
jgi:hypothetical protein